MKLGDLLGVLARGMHVVSLCAGHTHEDMLALGATPRVARQLEGLHRVYFGQTAFSAKQRRARETNHALDTLLQIERHVARVKNSRQAWDLRVELCATPEGEIAGVAKRRLAELTPEPTPGVRVRRSAGGMHKLIITDRPRAIANLVGTLKATSEDLLKAVHEVFSGSGAPKPALHAHVIVRLEQLDKIVRGEGDDILLQATDGGTMTGAEFLRTTFSERGFVSLFHPVEGPVNVYYGSRFANDKQRILLSAEHPTCAWLGCTRPAAECQMHHIRRWQDGGPTNLDNLVPLCKYHNAINDDDPARPTYRGRIDRIEGRMAWLPPDGGPPVPIPSPVWD
ncbi:MULTISPECIES: HNH endonuclease signature motif containing protein [Corynebacterium]|uniref:HNH endonuclease signature motif containing protein n=1 Tax=Corynebacterium TaxID=1716 RepID=UPI0008A4C315|nr:MULTISPECIES: HNH endonuclease signature motif containing protein [Corynebacterium]MCZ9299274.1 HNH endonuclease [Corynebacterium hesseae]MDK8896871.1 HNH endonuclease signature motif containing protein [Corynebacterium sp. MSK004]OFM29010.1 hypothetical protein HMPREF2698_03980 [Corynebacterium sp. HMSC072A02]